ncbi:MAG TPA: ATP-binding protein [Gemmatimonadaceae bacterium]|nr:ATP-binding protein [Gemmatimonadaceae bacterium]
MIKIESVVVKELRGIRDLTLTLEQNPFVISGPNGSGKSGVVDAIQFALTGEMSRLKGAGTADITLADHGPHVERRNDPDAAQVTLNVFIPHLNKKASITRTIKKSKTPQITPNDAAVRAVFANLAEHGEVTLSRREIIKFILTEATKRSRDVQTLLKLDSIDETRATLKTTENKLWTEQTTAKGIAETAEESLKRHLDVPALKVEDVLAAVNKRRNILAVADITALTKDTDVTDGIAQGGGEGEAVQSKESALVDLGAVSELVSKGLEASTQATVTELLKDYAAIEADPGLLDIIKRQPFLQDGLGFIDGPACPLCDTAWDIDALRKHLRDKLAKSETAKQTRDRSLKAGQAIATAALKIREQFAFIPKLPEAAGESAARMQHWSGELFTFSEGLKSLEGVMAAKDRIKAGWAKPPYELAADLKAIEEHVKKRPDKSATEQARNFLVLAQERLTNWRRGRREFEQKKVNAARGRAVYKTYCDVSEKALTKLYEEVEEEFSEFYRLINQDDEGEFKAKLEPEDGKLGLLVDFHKKGMFPPGAYHSEGHQDGMGVCLYLALMKRVLGASFTFAVLDDVVMSVDSQHRKQFCKLLKSKFPATQFVITTHDQVWARQIRSEGLIGPKAHVAFHTWTVETGPVLDEVAEVWDQIHKDLAKNEVPTAAGRLRRHLEYVAADLADELGAKVKYRADGGYDMGELLSAVISRQGELLKQAAKAAKSWGDDEQVKKVDELQKSRSEIMKKKGGEDWVINKAIHYNEWANLSCEDFKPVVDVFKTLLELFRCPKPKCDSWMSVTPRNEPIDLRCSCGTMRLNLKEK